MVQSDAHPQYFYGTGKRKTAIARVRIYPDDSGPVIINGKPIDEYFGWSTWQRIVDDAFRVTSTLNRFRVVAKVAGGGVNAQAEAVRHGITRALIAFDPAMKPALRRAGYVTRDPRIKESKKYGLKRARRAPQYTKR